MVLNLGAFWCYSCDRARTHEVRYMSKLDFTAKLLVCMECAETFKKSLGGPR